MEKIKKGTLKKSFICSMLITIISVVFLSVITIFICLNIQESILPDSNTATLSITTTFEDGTQQSISQKMKFGESEQVYQLTSDTPELKSGIPVQYYSIEKIDNGLSSLTPHRRNIYMILSVLMIVLPAVYSISGILLCALWFYKKKLNPPIKTLSFAAEQIAQKELDFKVETYEENELGLLCQSFESMRQALYENNKQLLSMLEERRMMQASVAHDLRNPIMIIEGYTEYIQKSIEDREFSKEKMNRMLSNIETAAKRLERYTNSIQDIYKLEDLEIDKKQVLLPNAINEMMEDFELMVKSNNIMLRKHIQISECQVWLDMEVLYRVIENIISNSLRYAKSSIIIHAEIKDDNLKIVIQDDGNGFSDKVLNTKNRYSISMNTSDYHMGMGLIISRILCKKHGGFIDYYNAPDGGAVIETHFKINH